jgi:hypothetical protein
MLPRGEIPDADGFMNVLLKKKICRRSSAIRDLQLGGTYGAGGVALGSGWYQ